MTFPVGPAVGHLFDLWDHDEFMAYMQGVESSRLTDERRFYDRDGRLHVLCWMKDPF